MTPCSLLQDLRKLFQPYGAIKECRLLPALPDSPQVGPWAALPPVSPAVPPRLHIHPHQQRPTCLSFSSKH